MKISLNWLGDHINIPVSPEDLSDILTDLGLEVEGLDKVQSIPGGLAGLVVGEVVDHEKHPNADKLSLCKVVVENGQEPLSIVCGAPNVAKGQKVIVATVGATLYGGEEPWTIKKGKIRGEVSEGMICAEDEIGIGNDHDGTIVLPSDTAVGTPASTVYNVEDDIVYDIGLTPNRSDATSHRGVAKDLLAYFRTHGYPEMVLKPLRSNTITQAKEKLPIQAKVEDHKAAPRFSGICLSNIEIKESPDWIKNRLVSIGVRPISNMVDVTNFILHDLGQPLHAFDYDAIAQSTIIVKKLAADTPFESLDGKIRTLSNEDLMICDGNEKPMSLAGIFGGLKSGVQNGTKRIFLEAAHFNPTMIRKSSTRHLLRTDAAIRFEKGSDPNITVEALKQATYLMGEYGSAQVASDPIDLYPEPIKEKEITVSIEKVNRLIGQELGLETIEGILTALEIDILQKNDESLTVKIPTNKADVTRDVDVIEELLRVYGFNNIEVGSTLKTVINPLPYPQMKDIREKVADFLTGKGYNEMMNLSITNSDLYAKHLPELSDHTVAINNTSNINLDIMRPEMVLPSLQIVQYNQNRQVKSVLGFEFGKSYIRNENSIQEEEHLIMIQNGQQHEAHWLENPDTYDYYSIKKVAIEVLERLSITTYQTKELEDDRFDYGIEVHRGPVTLCKYGRIAQHLRKGFDLNENVYYAEINIKALQKSIQSYGLKIMELSKFPSVSRDLALIVNKQVSFAEIERIVKKADKKILQSVQLFDVYENEEHLGEGKKSYAINLTFEDPEKTLSDKNVDKVIKKILASLEHQLGAVLR